MNNVREKDMKPERSPFEYKALPLRNSGRFNAQRKAQCGYNKMLVGCLTLISEEYF